MGITKEFNRKPPMNCYFIYTIHVWSMLMINSPTLIYTYCLMSPPYYYHKINIFFDVIVLVFYSIPDL